MREEKLQQIKEERKSCSWCYTEWRKKEKRMEKGGEKLSSCRATKFWKDKLKMQWDFFAIEAVDVFVHLLVWPDESCSNIKKKNRKMFEKSENEGEALMWLQFWEDFRK